MRNEHDMSLNINNMRKPWSREETIVAFYVYCKVPFKESGKENPSYDITPRYSAEVPVP